MDTFEVNSFTEVSPNHKYSGFGVILDTTRGIRVKSQQTEYSTQIKLIDKDFNTTIATSPLKGYVTVFIFWTSEDHQPFPFKIGDILRFNQFDFEKYKDFLQAKNRKGSSWCIYHGDSSNNEPYCHSAEYREKNTQYHVQRLHEVRQWSQAFFQNYSLKDLDWYSYERHLENPSVVQSFDMLLRVEEVRMPSDQTSELLVLLVDEKLSRYYTHVSSFYGRFLKQGDIVKLRSIERIDQNYLKGHSRYFAVLAIPSNFKDYAEFIEVISIQDYDKSGRGAGERLVPEVEGEEDQNNGQSIYSGFDTSIFEKPGVLLQGGSVLSSAVSSRRSSLPKKTALEVLRELEQQDYKRVIRESPKFHLRLTLVDIRPKSLLQGLRYECKACRLLRKIDAPEGDTCCQRKMEKTMLLRLLWQDQSLKSSKKLLISYVAPGDSEQSRCIFPDFPLKDLRSGELEADEKLWEEIVERYVEDDRLFDIILEPYDNISLKDLDGQLPLRITDTLFVSIQK